MNNAIAAKPLPPMQELKVSNALLGDRAALDAAWERDGYWFFRGVLDKDAVARYRDVYMAELEGLGVADRHDPKALYNGKSLEGFPFRMEPLAEKKPWKAFVSEPPIHEFFRTLLNDEPFWVPTVEYRATPPAQDRSRHRMDFVHQDGFYNEGIPFRICWIPLAQIDSNVGGLALAEGLHRGPYLHDLSLPPPHPIPLDAVPDGSWRRTTYQAGDVLLMDINTPHTGLSNHSDRFRLSMDIRVMGSRDHTPIVGRLTAISSESATIVGEDGRNGTFVINDKTWSRGLDGQKIAQAEVPSRFHVGDDVILAQIDGCITCLRPPH